MLSREEHDKLMQALEEVYDADASDRTGSHAILIATLNSLGRYVTSVEEAITTAESLLNEGWTE